MAQGRGIGSPVCQGAEGSSDEVKGRGFGNGGGVGQRLGMVQRLGSFLIVALYG